jgi:hypothetical protein
MKENAVIELMAAMRRQTALFEIIIAEEVSMRESIRDRDWERLAKSLKTVEALEGEIKVIEENRSALFSSLLEDAEVGPESGFYVWAVTLPEALRDEITETYRVLKYRALAARVSGAGIATYLTETRRLLGSIMEELFPQKRARIYDRRGVRREPEMRSVVLDKSL